MSDGRLARHQRQFLRSLFEGSLLETLDDTEGDGTLSAGNVNHAANTKAVLDWLRGGETPGAEVREFLEEQLDSVDEATDYDGAVYEHDAFAAAIEELR